MVKYTLLILNFFFVVATSVFTLYDTEGCGCRGPGDKCPVEMIEMSIYITKMRSCVKGFRMCCDSLRVVSAAEAIHRGSVLVKKPKIIKKLEKVKDGAFGRKESPVNSVLDNISNVFKQITEVKEVKTPNKSEFKPPIVHKPIKYDNYTSNINLLVPKINANQSYDHITTTSPIISSEGRNTSPAHVNITTETPEVSLFNTKIPAEEIRDNSVDTHYKLNNTLGTSLDGNNTEEIIHVDENSSDSTHLSIEHKDAQFVSSLLPPNGTSKLKPNLLDELLDLKGEKSTLSSSSESSFSSNSESPLDTAELSQNSTDANLNTTFKTESNFENSTISTNKMNPQFSYTSEALAGIVREDTTIGMTTETNYLASTNYNNLELSFEDDDMLNIIQEDLEMYTPSNTELISTLNPASTNNGEFSNVTIISKDMKEVDTNEVNATEKGVLSSSSEISDDYFSSTEIIPGLFTHIHSPYTSTITSNLYSSGLHHYISGNISRHSSTTIPLSFNRTHYFKPFDNIYSSKLYNISTYSTETLSITTSASKSTNKYNSFFHSYFSYSSVKSTLLSTTAVISSPHSQDATLQTSHGDEDISGSSDTRGTESYLMYSTSSVQYADTDRSIKSPLSSVSFIKSSTTKPLNLGVTLKPIHVANSDFAPFSKKEESAKSGSFLGNFFKWFA